MSMTSASKPLRCNRWRNTTELPPSPYVPITSGSTRPIRTVESATGQRSIQRQKRGVVRDHLDMPGRARPDGLDGVMHQRVLDAGIAQTNGQIGSALTRSDNRMVHEVLEVD